MAMFDRSDKNLVENPAAKFLANGWLMTIPSAHRLWYCIRQYFWMAVDPPKRKNTNENPPRCTFLDVWWVPPHKLPSGNLT